MYSRYTPNQDGGFDRTSISSPPVKSATQPAADAPSTCAVHLPPKPTVPRKGLPAFLEKRLHRGFDGGDLLILLILLLILQDSQEDKLAIGLTIAFFLLL